MVQIALSWISKLSTQHVDVCPVDKLINQFAVDSDYNILDSTSLAISVIHRLQIKDFLRAYSNYICIMESWLSTGLFTLVVVRLCTPLSLNTTNALVSMFTVLNDGNGNTLQLKSVQSAVCILPSVCLIPLSSPQSAVCSPVVCRSQFAVRSPQSAVCSPRFAVYRPQFAVRSPQSAVCSMQYAVCSPHYQPFTLSGS